MARKAFEQLAEAGKSTRKTRFGLALATIQEQPRTSGRIESGREQFQDLVDESALDDVGIASRYQLIRLLHVYTLVPSLDAAQAGYLELFRQHPDTFWGQQAFYRYLVLLVSDNRTPSDRQEDLHKAESVVPTLDDPSSRRDCALLLADYYQKYDRKKPKALDYFNLAYRTGEMDKEYTFRDIYMAAAGTAWDLGEWKTAARYYRLFLDVVENDSAMPVARDRLSQIESMDLDMQKGAKE
jgi:tetratricopeptide (TPR) repeat protein